MKEPHWKASDGFTLTEIVIALAITAAIMSAAVQGMIGLGRTQIAGQQRTLATEETANLMEAIQARSWEQVTADERAAWQLSEQFQRVVPRATLHVTIISIDEPVAAKRITIEIHRSDSVDRNETLSSLTAWKYFRQGAEE